MCTSCSFVFPWAFVDHPATQGLSRSAPRSSHGLPRWRCAVDKPLGRRTVLLNIASLAATLIFPLERVALAEEAPPSLPRGAREFNSFRAAQMQWVQVGDVVKADRDIADDEWSGLRAFLRVFYKVADDMEFLSSNFSDAAKKRVSTITKDMRKTVKGMDKAAIRKDRSEFGKMYALVASGVDEFYELLKTATVGDIPEDL